MRAAAPLLLAAALLGGCASGGCPSQTVSRLYLGRDSPQGDVSDLQWEAFVADTVAPRFPNGFTVFDARGHWRGDSGAVVKEGTRVVELVRAEADAPAVDAIADAYRRRFAQEAVLVTHARVQACLRK
jgi:hypothetical protein